MNRWKVIRWISRRAQQVGPILHAHTGINGADALDKICLQWRGDQNIDHAASIRPNTDMDLGLDGKVVLVTGGAGRIGPVICAAFAREGARVGVLDIDGARAQATAAGLRDAGGQSVAVQADVSTSAAVVAAVQQVTAALGPVDVLVNAHGVAPNRAVLEADEEEWD